MPDSLNAIQQAANALRGARQVMVFAGAGLSAESGLPTFRDQRGLWEGHNVEDVATPAGFQRDPVLVWKFYAQQQERQDQVEPNPGHYALAEMESIFPRFLLVTQNVDNLSARAGSSEIIKIHGDLSELWCTACQRQWTVRKPVPSESLHSLSDLPRCSSCGGLARPGIVWFGEMLPSGAMEMSLEFIGEADALISVGTSAMVSGGYGFAEAVKSAGGVFIEVNPAQTYVSHLADIKLSQPSALALPELVKMLKQS